MLLLTTVINANILLLVPVVSAVMFLVTTEIKATILLLTTVIVAVSVLLKVSKEPQNRSIDEHFKKIGLSFYDDKDHNHDETSIHQPISFFISNVSTLAFFSTILFYLLENEEGFIDKIPPIGIFTFPIMEIFIFPYMKVLSLPSMDTAIYNSVLFLIFLTIVYVLSLSFGRVAVSLGKRNANEFMALAIIIWMFTALGIVIVITSFISSISCSC
jgi:hypothetical protein